MEYEKTCSVLNFLTSADQQYDVPPVLSDM